MRRKRKGKNGDSQDDTPLFDYFGSRQAGEEAVLENTPKGYRETFKTGFCLVFTHPDCKGVASQVLLGFIGMPPNNYRAAQSLMHVCVEGCGLVEITSITSPYDLRKKKRDKRHEHPLRIWGLPTERAHFATDPQGWLALWWRWWHDYFPPAKPGVDVPPLDC